MDNTGSAKVSLQGVRLSAAVEFTFGELVLDPGAYAVVAENAAAFSNRYLNAASPYYESPVLLAGTWSGQLSNSGESVLLLDREGGVIQSFAYETGDPWPKQADGSGPSLECAHPERPPGQPYAWRASSLFHGSPGRSGYTLSVVINEIMSHSDTGVDWIELLNIGTNAQDISGWYLSDTLSAPFKFALPAREPLAPGAFEVYTQADFAQGSPPFAFSELGEEAVLIEAAGTNILRVMAFEAFGAADRDVPFGRYLRYDGSAAFTTLSAANAAAANAAPLVGPVVIGEIMYHPPESKPEYVELVNITAAAVPLYDPNHPANTWQLTSAVTYAFPQGTLLPAYKRLLVTETDPASFRSAYAVPADTPVFGPWSGQLSNDGESLRLCKPGTPESDGTIPLIAVDRVDYANTAPWPQEADGGGASLERLDLKAFGDDGRNGYAAATSRGTPGSGADPGSGVPNQYPALAVPSPLYADEGQELVVHFQASDPDSGQQLSFSLQGTIPAGATISPSGEFRWTPSEEDGPGTVYVRVAVTDSGIPNLTDVVSVPVTVREINRAPALLRGANALSTNAVPLVFYGSLWHYLDNGSKQGTLWRGPAFDASDWASGFARLGYGDTQKTTVGYGTNASSKYPTTYFRHTFTFGTNVASDALWIDFGPTSSPVQAGFQRFTAVHEQVNSFTAQTFRAFGTLVTVKASWVTGAVNDAAQMYDCGTVYSSDTPDLMRDWIGTDRRVLGNPLTLTLSGLPPGSYTWLSYHHDTQAQTGLFNVTVTDALSALTTTNVDISAGAVPFSSVTTFTSALLSNGGDITLVFDKLANAAVEESFFVMNAFKLARQAYDTSGTLADLTLSLIRDDGAVVYLNGAEVVRDNMPTGEVGYLTLASAGVGGADETAPYLYRLNPGHLVAGANTLAVEVHQSVGNSSDLGFDLALEAAYLKGGPAGLTDYTVSAGEGVRFLCQSEDPDRPAQGILYQLGAGEPSGAFIDPRTGLFTWTPAERDGPAVITFTVIATDDGTPPLTAAESFQVTVLTPLKSGDVRFENGRVLWSAIPGDRYRIETCDDLRTADWQVLETRTATQAQEALADPAFSSVRSRFYRIISLRYAE